MRREAIATLTALTLLAGCISAPEEIDAAAARADSPLLRTLGAYDTSLTYAGDALVLRTNASPAGGTAAFWWQIPEGVILGDDEDDKRVEFLAAPVLLEEQQAPLEQWMLMAFLADGGKLALNQLAFGAPFSISVGGLLGGGSEEIERSLEPFLFTAGGEIRPGGRIGFVVSGIASEDVEMALVLLPLQKEWDEDEFPEDTDEFLAYLDGRARVALPVSGTGGMHQLAFHFEGGNAFNGATITTGPVERDGEHVDALLASRRTMTVSTSFASGGYGLAAASYDGQMATGTWAASADAHGAVSEASGPLVAALGPSINGWPLVVAMGEGDAPSATSLTLDTASAMGDALYLIQIDLDTTLEDLLGLAALQVKGMSTGADAQRERGDLTMRLGDARVRAVGFA